MNTVEDLFVEQVRAAERQRILTQLLNERDLMYRLDCRFLAAGLQTAVDIVRGHAALDEKMVDSDYRHC